MNPRPFLRLLMLILLGPGISVVDARPWKFVGIPEPMEAEFVGMENEGVVLRGSNGKSFEVPFGNFSPDDQRYLRALAAGVAQSAAGGASGKPITSRTGYPSNSVETLADQVVLLNKPMELHVTGAGNPILGSTFLFTSPDGWLFLDQIAPSFVATNFLKQMRVNGEPAVLDENIRVVQHAQGTVVIPHAPDFAAMTVFDGKSLAGGSLPLEPYSESNDKTLQSMKGSVSSFILKRGYMATIASEENGTGVSRNYVAQDHDLVVESLPDGLDDSVRFVRVFPWRWVSKKGIAGGIWQNLDLGWFYDWNIAANSSLDIEYVAIKQNRHWPDLRQDWKEKGINHLLGYNEPDRPDQANMSVDEAIKGWPELLGTGLRLGAPATSDGGLGWLYEFMDKADAAGLRVDYVPVHYYRATSDPGDAKGAAEQFYRFLKGIHDRVKRPLWITEWNNGANWTKAPDPDAKQQKEAIETMIRMLDETPFVERYAPYNWVEEVRMLQREDGSLTPAGEVYRDQTAPLSFIQPKSGK